MLLRATFRAGFEALLPAEPLVNELERIVSSTPGTSRALERLRRQIPKIKSFIDRYRENVDLIPIWWSFPNELDLRHHPCASSPVLVRTSLIMTLHLRDAAWQNAAGCSEMEKLIEGISSATEACSRIIGTFAAYIPLLSPRPHERRRSVDRAQPPNLNVLDVILSATKPFRADGEARGIEIICEEADLAAVPDVALDSEQALELASQLLRNAVNYAVPSSQVTVRAMKSDSDAFRGFTVENRGLRILKSEIDRVFRPGYRGARASKVAPGAGLGLFIAKTLVELNGGRIKLESEPIDSLTSRVRVTVLLPVTTASDNGSIPRAPSTRS
jgi:signal transduction histidine kinase